MKSLTYRADIDGLRAIAILSVLFFHADLSLFSGGYVGVDVFFVISGFLITRLIKNQVEEKTFSYGKFYLRRLRRLFPAMFFSIALCFIAAIILLAPHDLQRFTSSLIMASFSLANIYFWQQSGYFNVDSEFQPLLHMWSLGVEEQFYFFWPVILVFLLVKTSKWKTFQFLILGGVVSLALNVLFVSEKGAIFYLTPFRIFEFIIGAAMVWLLSFRPKNKYFIEAFLLIGLAIIAYPVFTYTKSTVFPSFNALLPCIGGALVIYCGDAKYTGWLLRNSLAVGIGRISYSLYLVHWPLFVFYKYYKFDSLTNVETSLLIFISIIVATAMYYWVEQPFRRGPVFGYKFSSSTLVIAFVSLSMVLVIPSLHASWNNGWGWRIKGYFQIKNPDPKYGGEVHEWSGLYGKSEVSPSVILYGDSHAKHYLYGFIKKFNETGISGEFILHPACMSFPSFTNVYQGNIRKGCIDLLNTLEKSSANNDKTIILAYSWVKNFAKLDGTKIKFESRLEHYKFLLRGIEEFMENVGSKRNFILIGNVPGSNTKGGYLKCAFRPNSLHDCTSQYKVAIEKFKKRRDFNPYLKKFANKYKNVYFIDPFDILCKNAECFNIIDGNVVYYDAGHLSLFGSRYFVDKIWDRIRSGIRL